MPGPWQRHIVKKGALSKARTDADGRLSHLPDEEGLTCAVAEQLWQYRASRPADDILRVMEVQFFSEAKIRSRRRTGKSAPRTDIQACSALGVRAPYAVFEAKMVTKVGDIAQRYLGPSGLGAFLDDEDPYPAHLFAGMLAYTVSDTADDWLDRIEQALATRCENGEHRERLQLRTRQETILFDRASRRERKRSRKISVAHMVLRFERVHVEV